MLSLRARTRKKASNTNRSSIPFFFYRNRFSFSFYVIVARIYNFAIVILQNSFISGLIGNAMSANVCYKIWNGVENCLKYCDLQQPFQISNMHIQENPFFLKSPAYHAFFYACNIYLKSFFLTFSYTSSTLRIVSSNIAGQKWKTVLPIDKNNVSKGYSCIKPSSRVIELTQCRKHSVFHLPYYNKTIITGQF